MRVSRERDPEAAKSQGRETAPRSWDSRRCKQRSVFFLILF